MPKLLGTTSLSTVRVAPQSMASYAPNQASNANSARMSPRSPRTRLADAEHVNVAINSARERSKRGSTPGTPASRPRSRSPSALDAYAPVLLAANGFWCKPAEREKFVNVALRCAAEFVKSGRPIEPTPHQRELATELERRYNAQFAPTWRCVVGRRTVGATAGGMSTHPEHPHVHFRVGSTPFLLFQEQHHDLFSHVHDKQLKGPEPKERTQAYANDPCVGEHGMYVSQRLHASRPGEEVFGLSHG